MIVFERSKKKNNLSKNFIEQIAIELGKPFKLVLCNKISCDGEIKGGAIRYEDDGPIMIYVNAHYTKKQMEEIIWHEVKHFIIKQKGLDLKLNKEEIEDRCEKYSRKKVRA